MEFMSLVAYPNLSFSLTLEHLIGYIKNQLSINYHVYFDKNEKDRLAKDILENYGSNHEALISDNLIYANCSEFDYFSGDFDVLADKITNSSITIDSDIIKSICRDYCRIQHTQRVNLAFIFKEEFAYDIDYMNPQDEFYLKQMIAKHERWWLTTSLEMFLDAALKIGNQFNADSFIENVLAFKESIAVEQPPFLNRIPDYIDSWEKNKL